MFFKKNVNTGLTIKHSEKLDLTSFILNYNNYVLNITKNAWM